MKKLTMEDLAVQLGVARSTISRALRGDPQVAVATQERVRQLADELGYRPNAAAQALHQKKTNITGLFLPRSSSFVFSNPYFSELLLGLSEVAEERGNPLLLSTSTTPDYARWPTEARVDGLVLLGSYVTHKDVSILNQLVTNGFPVVVIGTRVKSLNAVSVGTNERAGIWQALAHLKQLGHERVLFLAGPTHLRYAKHRKHAYSSGVDTFALARDEALIVETLDTEQSGYEVTLQAIKRVRFDAVLANNDLLAIGACRALQDAGLRVPEDVSVVGFDDIPLASLVRPKLTTVQQPVKALGAAAMQALFDLMDGKPVPDVRLVTKLCVRDSTQERGAT